MLALLVLIVVVVIYARATSEGTALGIEGGLMLVFVVWIGALAVNTVRKKKNWIVWLLIFLIIYGISIFLGATIVGIPTYMPLVLTIIPLFFTIILWALILGLSLLFHKPSTKKVKK